MDLPVNYNDLSIQMRKEVRNEYIRLQDGKCYHCHELLSEKPSASIRSMGINKRLFPETFFKYPVHLHHDHDTGMTLGAVHCLCNAVLWQYHNR